MASTPTQVRTALLVWSKLHPVRKRRLLFGWSGRQLALRCGWPYERVKNIENGKTALAIDRRDTWRVLEKLTAALKLEDPAALKAEIQAWREDKPDTSERAWRYLEEITGENPRVE